MKYLGIYIFDAVINFDKCYLREATIVFEPMRDILTSTILKGKEYSVGYSFIESFEEYNKEINSKYDFDIMRIEI